MNGKNKHEPPRIQLSRRGFMGGISLAALATGLSPSFLRAPLAHAGIGDIEPQFLILAASDRGDPLNCNCPGSYDHAGIDHPDDPGFAATPITLGSTTSTAAQLWTQLPQWALDRSCFIHNATRSAVHSEMPKILRLLGATTDQEMLPTLIARSLAPALETIQELPVNVGKNVNLTASGVALPRIPPTALKQLLTATTGPLADLRPIRDQHVDQIHAILKERGTQQQRDYLDARAKSREDARRLADDANSLFDMVEEDDVIGELLSAIALFKLRVTPVVTVSLPFGGDNHSDAGLQEEIDQHAEGIAALNTLLTTLDAQSMRDQVTLAVMNVFGRNLPSDPSGGRDHWSKHAVSLLLGAGVKGGVVGGLAPDGEEYQAVGIDSLTGQGILDGGDVTAQESLIATGKTIWRACGASVETVNEGVESSLIIEAALAS